MSDKECQIVELWVGVEGKSKTQKKIKRILDQMKGSLKIEKMQFKGMDTLYDLNREEDNDDTLD